MSLAAFDGREQGSESSALIAEARSLTKPEGCGEAVRLLWEAADAPDESGVHLPSVASALRPCSDEPAAQELFLSLLQRTRPWPTLEVVSAWVSEDDGTWRGRLPAGTAAILEQRLAAEPSSSQLYQALDVVYQATAADDARIGLLRRWQRATRSSFGTDSAIDLARGLMRKGDPAAAVEVLESQLESHFAPKVAEMLWGLYFEIGKPEGAERLAGKLIGGSDYRRRREGHLLAARLAFSRGDLDGAEEQYWRALEVSFPPRELAVEALSVVASRKDSARVESTARRICEQTGLYRSMQAGVPGCVADLLARVGEDDAAARYFEEGASVLPEVSDVLRGFASKAQAAGQAEVAERTLRRALEIDPRDESNWAGLAKYLEQQGRVEDLFNLLERSRAQFPSPPSSLYRAAARALVHTDQPSRGIDLFLEARERLPSDEIGERSRGWINQELREAYEKLGRQMPLRARSPAPEPAAALPASEPLVLPRTNSVLELRLVADALLSGTGGRYDPTAAVELYERGASLGDPLATFRLALVRMSPQTKAAPDEISALALYRRSVGEVSARAKGGDAYAQYLLGTAALLGLGQAVDPASARRWLEAAAAHGDSGARRNLGWMQETGLGLERPDPRAALESYRLASRAGDCRAMFDVARLTMPWGGVGPECEEGLRWLERASQVGLASAAAFLGKVRFLGHVNCVPRDPRAALPWLEAAVATHQPGSDFDLGLALVLSGKDAAARERGLSLLERSAAEPAVLPAEIVAFLTGTGLGVPRDLGKHREWMAEAVRLGSDSFDHLALQMDRSEVLRELVDAGARRLEQLASGGDPAAAALLARLSSREMLADVDSRNTVALARQAAAAGEVSAMANLSWAYRVGEGVEVDLAESHRWLRRCATGRDSFCMRDLGILLLQGEEYPRDLRSGLDWLRRSAAAGNWRAIADLGNLYDEGWYGIPPDRPEAAAWKRRLADLGDPAAIGWLRYYGYL